MRLLFLATMWGRITAGSAILLGASEHPTASTAVVLQRLPIRDESCRRLSAVVTKLRLVGKIVFAFPANSRRVQFLIGLFLRTHLLVPQAILVRQLGVAG